jgi:hypothetical protein
VILGGLLESSGLGSVKRGQDECAESDIGSWIL